MLEMESENLQDEVFVHEIPVQHKLCISTPQLGAKHHFCESQSRVKRKDVDLHETPSAFFRFFHTFLSSRGKMPSVVIKPPEPQRSC